MSPAIGSPVGHAGPPPSKAASDVVAVLGLGNMGRAIASTLAAAGFRTHGWTRSGRPEALAADVKFMATPGEAIRDAPVVVVCLADTTSVRAVLSGAHGPLDLAGRDVVNLTTGDPDDADELAAVVSSMSANLLTGVIVAFPDDIGEERTQIVFGGPEATWERSAPLASTLGGASWWAGPSHRSPAVLDTSVALNLYHVALAGLVTSACYAMDNGVSAEQFLHVARPTLAAVSVHAQHVLAQLRSGEFATDQATIDVHRAALVTSRETMGDCGELLDPLIAYLTRAHDAGDGNLSFAAFSKQLGGTTHISEPTSSDTVPTPEREPHHDPSAARH